MPRRGPWYDQMQEEGWGVKRPAPTADASTLLIPAGDIYMKNTIAIILPEGIFWVSFFLPRPCFAQTCQGDELPPMLMRKAWRSLNLDSEVKVHRGVRIR